VPAYVDVSVKEAHGIMDRAEYRIGTMAWWGKHLEINFDGHWRVVCRTDECDDVCTGRAPSQLMKPTLEQWIEFYKKKIMLGARIYNDRETFAVIDAFSDG
jgi:hypothetical protein